MEIKEILTLLENWDETHVLTKEEALAILELPEEAEETLIAAAAFLLMLAAAKYTLLTALLLPFIGAFVCARQDAAWITAFYITAGAFFYLLLSGHWWLYFAVFILASLPAGFAIRFKLRSFDAIIIALILYYYLLFFNIQFS